MTRMIRKQVYLEPRQDSQIKQLAQERGTTEAAVIREAVDLLLAEAERLTKAQGAWEMAQALMEARAAYATQPPGRGTHLDPRRAASRADRIR